MTKQEETLIVLNKYANDYLTAKEDYPAFEYAIECVKDRKVGHWESVFYGKYEAENKQCSVCHHSEKYRIAPYCRWCGAKMEGSEEDAEKL